MAVPTAVLLILMSAHISHGLQVVTSWVPQHQHQHLEDFSTSSRQPITAELQNQVNALSAQLAAANRQLKMFQQQLELAHQPQVNQQPAQAQPQQQHLVAGQSPFASQQVQPQANIHHVFQAPTQQHQFTTQFQPQLGQSSNAQVQPIQQPQLIQPQFEGLRGQQPGEQPIVSTLADNPADSQHFSTNLEALLSQARSAQTHDIRRQPPALSTTASPVASIEQPSLSTQQMSQAQQISANLEANQPLQQQQQQQQQPQQAQSPPSLDQAPPHDPPKNEDKFSIGLGVLSPGYTQKFGNTALDFNQDKNGFSFTLSNNGHSNQPQQPAPRSAEATAPSQ